MADDDSSNSKPPNGFRPPNRPTDLDENEHTPTADYERGSDPVDALFEALQSARKKNEKKTNEINPDNLIEDDETMVFLRSKKAWVIAASLLLVGVGSWALLGTFGKKANIGLKDFEEEPKKTAPKKVVRKAPTPAPTAAPSKPSRPSGGGVAARPVQRPSYRPASPPPKTRGAVFQEREKYREKIRKNREEARKTREKKRDRRDRGDRRDRPTFPDGSGNFFEEGFGGDDWNMPSPEREEDGDEEEEEGGPGEEEEEEEEDY